MKTLKNCGPCSLLTMLAVLGIVFASSFRAHAQCCVMIVPPTNNATINMSAPWGYDGDFTAADNPATFIDQLLSGPPAVPPGTYNAWCIDVIDDVSVNPNNYSVSLFSSCDTNLNNELPAGYPANCYVSPATWHEINYLLNHKNGAYFWDVQNAIWYFIGGPAPSVGPPSYPATDTNEVNALINDTLANSSNWVSQCGDVVAVVVSIDANPHLQLTIMEVPCCGVSFTQNTLNYLTNMNLGCNPNPGSIPTCQSPVNTNLINATSCCGRPVTITCSESDSSVDCKNFRILTYTATDGYGNTATASQTICWTVDTNVPVITMAPGSTNLGCNPPVLPTDTNVQAQVKATALCSTPVINVTHVDSGSPCAMSRIFTITATDACGNVSTPVYVTYTWTVNTTPPVITHVPSGTNYGCNPANLANATNIQAQVTATANCGSAIINVTQQDSGSPCAMERVFTITASDSCGNVSVPVYVTNTWTVNTTPPIITCPSNVIILTNITSTNPCSCKPLYCTFCETNWGGPCNNPTWWNNGSCNWANWTSTCANWCGAWTNFWSTCNGSKATNNPFNCFNWNLCAVSNCWGIWNQNNIGGCWWLPCNGNSPGCILTNCFKTVYTNGCTIGWPGSNTYYIKCSTANDVRNCLGFTGNSDKLNCNAVNPVTCNAGSFCSKVLALQLNCDISDADCNGTLVGRCGDLVYCDPTSPCNGRKVRDICKIANCALGGGDCKGQFGCDISISNLCSLVDCINHCFESCQPSSWCTNHFTNAPVTAPPPSQTGYATATDTCDGHPVITYTDAQVAGPCSNSVEFIRTWKATDSCGNSSICQQTITIGNCTPPPPPCSASISGEVVRDCNGDGKIEGGEPGIGGVTVTLKKNGSTVATTITATNGTFTFSNVTNGTYTVTISQPSGCQVTYPANCNNQITVTVANCQNVTGVNFAYTGTVKSISCYISCPQTAKCGQTITYTCTVTNTGTTCFNTCTVSSPSCGGWTYTCPTPLPPGGSCTFTKTYTCQSWDAGNLGCSTTCYGWPNSGNCATGQSSCNTYVSRY